MSSAFAPSAAVEHPRHGAGRVVLQSGDLVIVEFESGLQRVPAGELTAAASLAAALAEGRAGDPVEAVLRAQALAITSVNEQWGVFSRSRVQILPHQLWVCRKVTATWPFRWLVADDVGLGKTIEAGLILMPLLAANRVRRLLVLAPAKLVPQWRARLKAMFDIRLQQYAAAADSARGNFWDTATMAVASFHTLRADGRGARTRLLEAEPWDLVIVDEAHHLNLDERSGDTLAYGLLREMQERGRVSSLLLFTGTPHRGKDYGFFGLMRLLRPDLFDPEADREGQLAALSQAMIRNNKATVTDLKGERLFRPVVTESRDYAYSGAEDLFYRTLSDFILDGRAYADTLTGRAQTTRMLVLITLQKLAASSIAAIQSALTRRRAKLERALAAGGGRDRSPPSEAEPGDEEDAAAEFAALLMENEIARLDELIALAAAASPETKIARLLDLIETELDPGEPVLFFTEYKATQALVLNALNARFGADTGTFINGDERLDGVRTATGLRTISIGREVAADAFNGGKVRFLISTEAGGEGIDLQERCSTLIHIDMPWNPMRLHQRVGRLSRYGQREEVRVFLLRNPATVEARIWDLLSAKLERIQAALSNAMEEREDITRLVIGIAGEAFFNELYAGAGGRRDNRLADWFDEKTATLGGRDVIDTARDLFGNVARFDFQAVGRDVPKVDLPALEPFFAATLQRHGRRVSRSDDDGSLAFKTPTPWRERSWSVDDRYEGLVFDRTLRGENAASRVLGVGHQLMDLAVQEARELPVRLASLDSLDAPLLIASVEDEVTGTGGTVHRLIFGVQQLGGSATVFQDWELLTRLNELTLRRPLTSFKVSNGEFVRAAGESTDRLLTALRLKLPRTTAIFVRPMARAEMLLIPAAVVPDQPAASP
ncbi:DEAD/DEAH box helicase [Methylobacterium mesophilicum]|uniref:DEAD/DEAH box helicase n=1 Tax=Methylobacterium mesophilicum TaxID=39956 RepID=UPI002F2EC23A